MWPAPGGSLAQTLAAPVPAPGIGERTGTFLALVSQLALLTLVIFQFQLESSAFLEIFLITLFGFCLHYFLPLRFRLPFFLLLSLAGIANLLGFVSGGLLVGIGLALIGLCHLPIPFAGRVALVLGAAGLLTAFRAAWIPLPAAEAVWPILGSMFMFRLIVYLYDLRHEKSFSFSRSLSYFFLLPNICFPLFPVIDYKSFRRNYYDADEAEIYQRGMQWILRGVTHLILYRLVYYHLTLSPNDVHSPAELVRFLITNILLYLRVSGQFHLIIGMLHLFGFRLPETNRLYFLASSFNDFWRRINIYWKDFMIKVFYYPIFFRLKKLGPTTGLVLSTVIVFIITWLLHSYQWFWLRGTFPLNLQDGLYWGILGGLVIVNTLWESKKGRRRSLGKQTWTPQGLAIHTLKIIGVFTVVTVLWSMWTADTFAQWLNIWNAAGGSGEVADARLLSTLLVVGVVLHSSGGGPSLGTRKKGGEAGMRNKFRKAVALNLALTVGVLLLGTSAVYDRFGTEAAKFMHTLRESRLSGRDAARLEQGYYENLMDVGGFNSRLWEIYRKRPTLWLTLAATDGLRDTDDWLRHEQVPDKRVFVKGATFTINRWGMRDQDYELAKPPGAYRIALIGSSIVGGSGLEDDQTFESMVERALNEENGAGSHEILNFGVGGYTPLHQPMVLERKVKPFHPDAVIYMAHLSDERQAGRHLAERLRAGVEPPDPFLTQVAREVGVDGGTEEHVANRSLAPRNLELLSWSYGAMARAIRAQGAVPIFIYLASLKEEPAPDQVDELLRRAREAGFEIIIDLRDVYEGYDEEDLILAEWDFHPNADGHVIIAERLHDELRQDAMRILLGDDVASSGPDAAEGASR